MKNTIVNLKPSRLWICLATALTLSACGGTGQDDGEVNDHVLDAKGLSIDGYLARATVFIDSNNNGTRDPWEPWAFTDNDGYYSFNPKTGVNYCSAQASQQERQYCLTSNVEFDEAVVRIDSGYDVTTGEPFLGQLSRRADLSSGSIDTIISPISTLLSNVEASDQEAILNALDIDESDLDVDYLNTDGGGEVDAKLLNTAVTIHKTVTILADKLEDNYTEIGETIGVANDASDTVYEALADAIVDAVNNSETPDETSLDDVISDPETIVEVLDAAEEEVKEIYEQKDLTLPDDLGSTENPGELEEIASTASQIPAVVDAVIDEDATDLTVEDASGGVKAVEAVVIKVVDDDTGTDDTIDSAIEFFTDEGNAELVEALTESLASDSADVTGLATNDFSGDDFDSVEEITMASSLPEDVQPFTTVAGMKLKMAVLDLGSRPFEADDKEYEFYFEGQEGDIEGAFSACVKHIEGADETKGTLGDGNTRGELVRGFWSMLGATAEKQQSFSLLITITFLGTTYQGILKPNGMETIVEGEEEVEYHKVRFDNNGEILKVHSLDGFVELDELPNTNQECQQRLPSRLDL